MDVDRDKHFSVSDLQALEEEDNRVSGQALKKNTSFWNRFLLLQRLFSTRVFPHVVFANWFGTASFWGPFLSDLPTNQFKTNSAILNGYKKKTLRASVSQLRYELIGC